jgi:nitrite reductase (NADH) large subunit
MPLQVTQFAMCGDLWVGAAEQRVSRWPSGMVVCNCKGVMRGQLSACMAAGFVSIDALTRRTGASSMCGSCTPLLGQLAGTPVVADTRGRVGVLIASCLALVTACVIMFGGHLLVAGSVQQALHRAAELWRDPSSKQLTGYTLLALSVLNMVMSASRLWWRMVAKRRSTGKRPSAKSNTSRRSTRTSPWLQRASTATTATATHRAPTSKLAT